MAVVAERAGISRETLMRLERGDSGVSIGVCSSVLFALGLVKHFEDLADASKDALGRMLEEERLPQRIRRSSHTATRELEE